MYIIESDVSITTSAKNALELSSYYKNNYFNFKNNLEHYIYNADDVLKTYLKDEILLNLNDKESPEFNKFQIILDEINSKIIFDILVQDMKNQEQIEKEILLEETTNETSNITREQIIEYLSTELKCLDNTEFDKNLFAPIIEKIKEKDNELSFLLRDKTADINLNNINGVDTSSVNLLTKAERFYEKIYSQISFEEKENLINGLKNSSRYNILYNSLFAINLEPRTGKQLERGHETERKDYFAKGTYLSENKNPIWKPNFVASLQSAGSSVAGATLVAGFGSKGASLAGLIYNKVRLSQLDDIEWINFKKEIINNHKCYALREKIAFDDEKREIHHIYTKNHHLVASEIKIAPMLLDLTSDNPLKILKTEEELSNAEKLLEQNTQANLITSFDDLKMLIIKDSQNINNLTFKNIKDKGRLQSDRVDNYPDEDFQALCHVYKNERITANELQTRNSNLSELIHCISYSAKPEDEGKNNKISQVQAANLNMLEHQFFNEVGNAYIKTKKILRDELLIVTGATRKSPFSFDALNGFIVGKDTLAYEWVETNSKLREFNQTGSLSPNKSIEQIEKDFNSSSITNEDNSNSIEDLIKSMPKPKLELDDILEDDTETKTYFGDDYENKSINEKLEIIENRVLEDYKVFLFGNLGQNVINTQMETERALNTFRTNNSQKEQAFSIMLEGLKKTTPNKEFTLEPIVRDIILKVLPQNIKTTNEQARLAITEIVQGFMSSLAVQHLENATNLANNIEALKAERIKNSTLLEDLNKTNEENLKLQNEVLDLSDNLNKNILALEDTRIELTVASELLQEQLLTNSKLEKHINEVQDNIKILMDNLQKITGTEIFEFADITSAVNNMKLEQLAQINSLNDNINNLQQQNNSLVSLIEDQKIAIQTLEENITNKTTIINHLTENLNSANAKINDLENTNNHLTENLNSANAKINDLENTNNHLTENLNSANAKINDLTVEKDNLEQKYKDLLEKYNEQNQDYHSLGATVERFNKQFKEMLETIKNLTEENEYLKSLKLDDKKTEEDSEEDNLFSNINRR
ncbi:hypothetical protein [Campylobacter sp. RM12651]|uniref:hypothetical protein n=1 Tax=Campylobacter sp. RM12651 TaxID=1660079 RepID=UPI001EFB89CC|nr:hypothetical protein [Campylobacter sp. RM12651]ULO04518.1 hypothetical protein AVBRAN_a0036 [Campylobacter sp. RM12651]